MPNVFVLCTGRNGSVTFAKACGLLTNYTSGHETHWRVTGDARTNYPNNHIEVDNRLSFFLGALDQKYGDDAIYVHLRRDPNEVAESYNKRWHVLGGLMKNWTAGISGGINLDLPAARFMIDTIEQNITHFLKDKTQKIVIQLDTLAQQMPEFLEMIGAKGDMDAVMATLVETHNPSSIVRTDEHTDDSETIKTLTYLVEMITGFRQELNRAKKEVARSNAEVARLVTKIAQARTEIAQAKTEIARLEMRGIGRYLPGFLRKP